MVTDSQTYALPLRLRAQVQQYAWGKRGADSAVAALLPRYDQRTPYAEFWVGAHPRLPSLVIGAEGEVRLGELIAKNPPAILGERIATKFSNLLPFLLKVLSVGQALSIQAHPDKALAEKLNAEKPDHYPDRNHKPELSIALTPVSLLYGFRSVDEITRVIAETSELKEFLHTNVCTIETIHRVLVSGDPSRRAVCVERLVQRFRAQPSLDKNQELLLALADTYGGADIGVLTSLLMNIVEIAPGQAIFIAPRIPHAYLSGDMIECMANSDNVVRAGLTTKYQDVETLLGMLDYSVNRPTLIEPDGGVYRSSAQEFELTVFEGEKRAQLNPRGEISVLLCLDGQMVVHQAGVSQIFKKGDALLIPASARDLTLETDAGARVVSAAVP